MKASAQGLALAAMTLSGAEAAAAELSRSLAKLEQLSQARAEQAALAAGADLKRATAVTLALVIAALLFGGLLVLTGYRSVRRPMAELERALQTLGAGDLTSPIHTHQRDEIGALIQTAETLRLRLRELVGRVAQASATVGRAANEIAVGTQDLSARTEHQASALQEAAASMEQINSTVHNNSSTAHEAGRMATEAARVAERGSAMVGEVIASMSAISGQSRRIAEITSVIDGIAFQTNILALNAAVEAARAGEQGRGFAVVAAEVRTLAQRSATAAREIKNLINESVQNVDRGADLVDSAGRTISQMVQDFSRVNTTIQAISAATHEQSSGVGQVSVSVNELDRMTQQNAALVEQSAAAAQVLSQQASQLQQALSAFRLEPSAAPA
jgi:methyl-accepting chemotaxis protein